MSTKKRIALLHGHPDASRAHYGHALADAYVEGATSAGHPVRRIDVAKLDFPWLRSQSDWETGYLPDALAKSQSAIGWADHVVMIFPLWLGTTPAMFKGFLEQVLRPGFAFHRDPGKTQWRPALGGKSARIIVTMGMPSLWYRLYYRAHGVKGIERNILKFCGMGPVRETYIGLVEGTDAHRQKALKKVRGLGARGA